MILCNDLHKQFGDVEAVKGVSMKIPDGMFWACWDQMGPERQR